MVGLLTELLVWEERFVGLQVCRKLWVMGCCVNLGLREARVKRVSMFAFCFGMSGIIVLVVREGLQDACVGAFLLALSAKMP